MGAGREPGGRRPLGGRFVLFPWFGPSLAASPDFLSSASGIWLGGSEGGVARPVVMALLPLETGESVNMREWVNG